MKTKIKLAVLFYVLLLAFGFTRCSAQFYSAPFGDCCTQSIALTKANAALTDSLRRKQSLLDTTRAVGGRIIAATDERLSQALKSGNMAVSEVNRYRAELTALGLRGWNPFFNRRKWARRVLGQ